MGKFSDTRFLMYNKNQTPLEYIRFDEMSEAMSIPTNTTGLLKTPLALSGTLQVVEDYAGTDSPLYLSTTAIGLGTTVSTATSGILKISDNAPVIVIRNSTNNSTLYGLEFRDADISGGSLNAFIKANQYSGEFRYYVPNTYFHTWYSSGAEDMRLTGGNLGINNTSPTAKLQVVGSGSTSATTSLLVQNSAGYAALTVLDNGCVFANGNGAISTNTAFGENALRLSGSGGSNGAFGSGALRSLTTGSENTGVGRSSLYSTNSGINNVSIGNYSLFACTSGSNNTAVGWDSIEEGATASNITAFGSGTRSGNFSGSVIIGKDATATAANQFVVGSTGTVAGTVDAEINASANVWNVVINGVARKILLA